MNEGVLKVLFLKPVYFLYYTVNETIKDLIICMATESLIHQERGVQVFFNFLYYDSVYTAITYLG